MTATRSRAEEKKYKKNLKSKDSAVCPFCAVTKGDSDYIEESSAFYVIKNLFAYSLWDGQTVVDHLMITPKKHTDNMSGFSLKEKGEYVDLLSKYEKMGYNVYARAPQSKIKSIVHQHTHLIKTEGAPLKFVLLWRKPYVRMLLK